MRLATLMASVPHQSSLAANERAAGRALPAELLPYAAAQLLPLWLLPPERVRALDLPQHNLLFSAGQVSDFLSAVVVSVRLVTVRSLEHGLCHAPCY